MGNAGNSAKSVHNDHDGKQQGPSEQRIRLVVLRLSLGHESSKTPEFSAEWMVNKEKQVVQKLTGQCMSDDSRLRDRAWQAIHFRNRLEIGPVHGSNGRR